MDTSVFTGEQLTVKDAMEKLCANFPNEYWQQRDQTETFPKELHAALAKDGKTVGWVLHFHRSWAAPV
jgi:acyl-CoA dehydrogenase